MHRGWNLAYLSFLGTMLGLSNPVGLVNGGGAPNLREFVACVLGVIANVGFVVAWIMALRPNCTRRQLTIVGGTSLVAGLSCLPLAGDMGPGVEFLPWISAPMILVLIGMFVLPKRSAIDRGHISGFPVIAGTMQQVADDDRSVL